MLRAPVINRGDWLKQASQTLWASKNTSTPRLDAELILAHVLKVERIELHSHPELILSKTAKQKADILLERRTTGYPIAYLLGHKEFFGHNFIVSSHVLIPRPETENLVSLAIELTKTIDSDFLKIADIGCGSGAIGLSLGLALHRLNLPYQITLSDISPEALRICRKNRTQLGVLNTKIIQQNLLQNQPESYHLIIANLPYVSSSWQVGPEIKFEPSSAIFADHEGLDLIYQLIEQICRQTSLVDNGWLVLEFDPCQQLAITQKLHAHGFSNIKHSHYATVAQFNTHQL